MNPNIPHLTPKDERRLKRGDEVFSIADRNAKGEHHRWRVTYTKTWKTRPDDLRLHFKRGLRSYARMSEAHEFAQVFNPYFVWQVEEQDLSCIGRRSYGLEAPLPSYTKLGLYYLLETERYQQVPWNVRARRHDWEKLAGIESYAALPAPVTFPVGQIA